MIKIVLLTSLFVSFGLKAMAQDSLITFETDYCTGYPEGTRYNPTQWRHCCIEHDMYFWAGGTQEDRDVSDLIFKSCIEETGATKTARLMYAMVRFWGQSPVKFRKKRWNHGWPERPNLQALTSEDVDRIEAELLRDSYENVPLGIRTKVILQLRSR